MNEILNFIDNHAAGIGVLSFFIFLGICSGCGAIWNTFHQWILDDLIKQRGECYEFKCTRGS